MLNTAGDLADVAGTVFDLGNPVPLAITTHSVGGVRRPTTTTCV